MPCPTALITGPTAGIGAVVARALVDRGYRLLLLGRNPERLRAMELELRRRQPHGEFVSVPVDLADLPTVARAARTVSSLTQRLELLIANAGLGGRQGLTQQGFELHFGVHHLAHFLLTRCLEPLLLEGAPSRLVVVTSSAHERLRHPLDLSSMRHKGRLPFGWGEYQRSKLANLLFVKAFAKRFTHRGVTSYAVHPGAVATSIYRKVPWPIRPLMLHGMVTPEEGALSTLRAALAPELAQESGLYYGADGVLREPSPLALDEAAAEALWAASEVWVRPWYFQL